MLDLPAPFRVRLSGDWRCWSSTIRSAKMMFKPPRNSRALKAKWSDDREYSISCPFDATKQTILIEPDQPKDKQQIHGQQKPRISDWPLVVLFPNIIPDARDGRRL